MFGSNRNEEAMLYYLYMMADGEVSYSEEKIFDSICNELNLDSERKSSVIEKCKELVDGTADVFDIIIRESIDVQAGEEWNKLRSAPSLARIIWNLINLGFADSMFSGEEKKIIDYLIIKWSVDSEVYQELIDTAETMLALTKQKEWIISAFSKGSERDRREKDVDVEIMQLLDDVKLTIEELAI